MNRTQVLEQIGPLTDLNRRKVTHSGKGRVLMEPDAIIIKPGDRQRGLTVPFKSQAEGALNGFIGLPTALKGKVQSDTYVRVVDDLLNRAGEFEVVTQGDEIVSFNRPGNITSLPVEKTLRTIEGSIRGDVDFQTTTSPFPLRSSAPTKKPWKEAILFAAGPWFGSPRSALPGPLLKPMFSASNAPTGQRAPIH